MKNKKTLKKNTRKHKKDNQVKKRNKQNNKYKFNKTNKKGYKNFYKMIGGANGDYKQTFLNYNGNLFTKVVVPNWKYNNQPVEPSLGQNTAAVNALPLNNPNNMYQRNFKDFTYSMTNHTHPAPKQNEFNAFQREFFNDVQIAVVNRILASVNEIFTNLIPPARQKAILDELKALQINPLPNGPIVNVTTVVPPVDGSIVTSCERVTQIARRLLYGAFLNLPGPMNLQHVYTTEQKQSYNRARDLYNRYCEFLAFGSTSHWDALTYLIDINTGATSSTFLGPPAPTVTTFGNAIFATGVNSNEMQEWFYTNYIAPPVAEVVTSHKPGGQGTGKTSEYNSGSIKKPSSSGAGSASISSVLSGVSLLEIAKKEVFPPQKPGGKGTSTSGTAGAGAGAGAEPSKIPSVASVFKQVPLTKVTNGNSTPAANTAPTSLPYNPFGP